MGERKGASRSAAAGSRKSTSLAVDPELHRRARVYAAQNDRKLQDVFNEALEEYLKKRGA
jgi:predicted HicB family RNase H-like nuclease